ncbi:g3024 [Coccomyxa elongata]
MDDHRQSVPDWLPPGAQLSMGLPYFPTPNFAAADYAWQGVQPAHGPGLPISPLNVGYNSVEAHPVSVAPTMCPSPTPAILGWHDQAGALATHAPAGSYQPGVHMRLRLAPSPIVINPQQRHQRQMHDAFERYVVQCSATSHVYGHQTQAAATAASPRAPVPVAFWEPPPVQLRTDMHPAAEPDLTGLTRLVRPQPMRPVPAPWTGAPLPPFAHPQDAFSGDICGHAAGEQQHQHRLAVAAAQPAARDERGREAQVPACNAQAAPLERTKPGQSAPGRPQAVEAEQHASASGPCADTGEVPQAPRPDTSAASGGHERQSAREHEAASVGMQGGAVLQSRQADTTPETPARSSAAVHVSDTGREVTARYLAPCSPDTLSRQEDCSDESVDIVALSQSPGSSVEVDVVQLCQASDSNTSAAESLRLAQEAGDRGAEAPCLDAHQNQEQPAAIQCSEPAMRSINCHAQDCSEVGAASRGVSVPVELLEDDITAERHQLERELAAAALLGSPATHASGKSGATLVNEPCTLGSRSMVDEHVVSGRRARVFEPCTELCQMGGAGEEAPVALGRGPRVTQPCTESSALAAGRSKRVPGGDPLANVHVLRLCEMLRGDSHDFQAAGRVLRLKQYVSADIKPPHIDAILDALAVNTRVEVLYIQNFEWGMLDPQLEHLEAVLRLRRIWALNVGENFQITLPAWARFTAALPHTAVAYLYVSEHHLGGTSLKIAMRDAIRVNRKRDPARDPEVISKVGNMWFNPRMPGQPSRKRARDTHAEPAEDAVQRKRKVAQAPSPPLKTAAEKAAERAAQKQAAALERSALPAWLPATVVDALQRAVQGPLDQPQQGEGAQTAAPKPANSQTALKRRVRSTLVDALRKDPDAAPLTEEEGRQASLTWILQRWRGMATAGNVWAPRIIATAAEQQQEQEEALAAAAAAAAADASAAAAAKAAARRDGEDAAASARELSIRTRAAGSSELSGMSLRDAVAAAGKRCTDCQTQDTPLWRRFEGVVYCNACWCRRRKWKEQESAEARIARGSSVQEQRSLRSAAVNNAAVQGSAASEDMLASGPAALPAAQQSLPLGRRKMDSAAAVSAPVAAAELQESMQAGAADVEQEEEDMSAAPAAAEPRQHSKMRSGRLVSPPASRVAAPAVQHSIPSQKRQSRAAVSDPAAGAERGRHSAAVGLKSPADVPAVVSSLQSGTRSRAAGLHSEAAAPAATSGVQRSMRSEAVASSSPAAAPAAVLTMRRMVPSDGAGLGSADTATAAGVAPRFTTRSGLVRMVSPPTVLPAVPAVQVSMPLGALRGEHRVAVLADVPGRKAPGRSNAGKRVRAAAADAAQRSRRSGADSSAAVLANASAKEGSKQSSAGLTVSRSAAVAAVPAVQRSGRASALEEAAAAPAAEPSAPAVTPRLQRAAKLAAPQLWRGDARADDSSDDNPPPKPKLRATLRLNEPTPRAAKPAAPARGWQTRGGSRLRLPLRAAKLAVARARHLSRRADELDYFGARPRSAAGRDGRSRLLHDLVQSVPVEGKRQRSVTRKMQEAVAGPRHGLGAIGVSGSKRKLHEEPRDEPRDDQQSSANEEPAAGRLSAPRGGCLKSHRVASIACGRAAGSGTEEGCRGGRPTG